jgi:hypothetical protein
MANVVLKRRIASNPRRKAKGRKKNSMTAEKKRAFVARMAKARRAKGNPTRNGKSNPRTASNRKKNGRKNPTRSNSHRNQTRNRRRRNPTVLSDPKGLAINIVTALLSAVLTRQLPQIVLGANNTGWKGYLGNVVSGAAGTFAAHEFIGPAAAQAAVLGSGVIVLDRVLTEQFSPVGKYLSLTGLGDATSATRLGEIAEGYYIHPTIFDAQGRPIIPHQITDAAVRAYAAMQPAAPAALAGVRPGNGYRPTLPRQAMLAPGRLTNNRFAGRA